MVKEYRVLVVDDAKNIHEDIRLYLKPAFSEDENMLVDLKNRLCESDDSEMDTSVRFYIDDAFQGEEAIALVERAEKEGDPYALVIMDIVMPPGMDGVQAIKEIWKHYPHTEVIIITAFAEYDLQDIRTELGITDKLFYLHKPFHPVTFKQAALTMVTKWDLDRKTRKYIGDLESEVATLMDKGDTSELKNPEPFSHIITKNAEMINLFKRIEFYNVSPRSILITGETGTGKELIAQAIHRISGRDGKLVAVDMGSIDPDSFSDTLFGHKGGTYTGVADDRQGAIVNAEGGILFLDEIQNLSVNCQNKLLRFLETGMFKPLGSDKYVKSDARVIAGSNVNLINCVENGKFRIDLYQRLSAHSLHIPSLRERKEDIPLLLNYFLEKISLELGKNKPAVSNELISLLSSYHYPGNVRELENMVFDAVCQHESEMLSMKVFRENMDKITKGSEKKSFRENSNTVIFPERMPTIEQVRCDAYEEALRRADGNVDKAAGLLKVTYQAVSQHLKKCKRNHFKK